MRTSRRSFLRGMGGAVLALPWLESLGGAAVNTVAALRAAWFYVPIGVVRRGFFPGHQPSQFLIDFSEGANRQSVKSSEEHNRRE